MSSPNKRRRTVAESDDEDDIDDGVDEERVVDMPSDEEEGAADPEEEDDGEDIIENAAADYAKIAELDSYDKSMLDKKDYENITTEDRQAAEKVMHQQSERNSRLDTFANAVDGAADEGDGETRRGLARKRDKNTDVEQEEGGDGDANEETDEEEMNEVNLDAIECPLLEWISRDRTRKEIKKRFQTFLTTFQGAHGRAIHAERIRDMCARNLGSLEVSYRDLSEHSPILAIWLADAPREMLEIFDEVCNEVVVDPSHFPSYRDIVDEVHVRITELPIQDNLRDLRQVHLNAIVRVAGVVTRRSAVFPQLKLSTYKCGQCGHLTLPFKQNGSGAGSGGGEVKPASCLNCQSDGPFLISSENTVYRNYQKITLQETPGSVPPGRVPRQKEVILLADLIDKARPGEEVEVIGIYMHGFDQHLGDRGQSSGFPVFSTLIEANHLTKKDDQFASSGLTDEDRADILKLARDPRIGERIVQSLAPSIYGQDHVKMAVALALFGGCPKNVNNKHRIRGDINVLLLGDPGTAKSQILKYSEKIAPRAVYTTGKGASAVGLTAGVRKDPLTKEWTLEGGALVLADRGLCLIDEFDKMSEQDRTSIHEAMEQQSISVSKAGIVTSLQARCAVIAAANPINGVYDSSCTLAENVELTDPILQRFDVLCVLQDTIDPIADEALARFVVGSHQRSAKGAHARAAAQNAEYSGNSNGNDDANANANANANGGDAATANAAGEGEGGLTAPTPTAAAAAAGTGAGSVLSGAAKVGMLNNKGEATIPQALLQKYIQYARTHMRPQLHGLDEGKLAQLYADLRRESATSGGVPIAVRHIESVMRMSEAHAKMHLRDHVRDDDLNVAIRVMLESFISAQKFSVRRSLRRGFQPYLTSNKDFNELLLHSLRQLANDAQTYFQMKHRKLPEEVEVYMDDLEQKARDYKVYDLTDFYTSASFKSDGFQADHERRVIVRKF